MEPRSGAGVPRFVGGAGLTGGRVAFLAFLAAATVANVCYAPPLAAEFARSFGVSEKSAGLVTALSQIGYGAGILVIVPFGDLVEQRKLTVGLLAAVSVSLVAAAMAPGIHFLAAAAFFVGATTIIPQVLIPYAAALAAPSKRAVTIGTIQGALLVGILLARTVAGEVAGRWGWREVYWLAAGAMVALVALVWFYLPAHPPEGIAGTVKLASSMADLLRRQPLLRAYSASSALSYACFSVFWSTLAFLLFALPRHYGPAVAGRFGLAGAAGALTVPWIARWSNRSGTHFTGGAGLAVCLLSIPIFWAGSSSLVMLSAAVVVVDMGLQANHVSNQTAILSLVPGAAGRINGIYMFLRFAGGAFGSIAGAWAWQDFGWNGVCAAGAFFAAAAMACHLRARREEAPDAGLKAAAPRLI